MVKQLYLHPSLVTDGSYVSTGACNLVVPGLNPVGTDIFHRGCAYTVLQTVQRH